MSATRRGTGPAATSLALPGILLGVGLGGFVDGILLHQLLQWHHMLSSTGTDRLGLPPYPVDTLAGLKINTVWDGLFHVFNWVSILVGLALLFSRTTNSRRPLFGSRELWGWVIAGWGIFNLVEGIVDHQILGIHHVHPSGSLAWDVAFLILGAVLLVGGWLLARSGARLRKAVTADRA